MSIENDPGFWRATIAAITGALAGVGLPTTMAWRRANSAQKAADETRVILAERHYTKPEVENLVDRAVGPIKEKLNGMDSKLDRLIERHIKGAD